MKVKLTELLSGDDWKAHYDDNGELLLSEESILIIDKITKLWLKEVNRRFPFVDIIEVMFNLLRYDKPTKARVMRELIYTHADIICDKSKTFVYSYSSCPNNEIDGERFGSDEIAEFIITMSGYGFAPAGVMKKYLNEDVLTFLEL